MVININALHDFNLLFIYLEHKIKGILAFSLNWKFNFKLLTQNFELGQNLSMLI